MLDSWDSAQGQTQYLDENGCLLYSPPETLRELALRYRMNDLPDDHVDSKIEEIENLFKDMEI